MMFTSQLDGMTDEGFAWQELCGITPPPPPPRRWNLRAMLRRHFIVATRSKLSQVTQPCFTGVLHAVVTVHHT